MKYFMRISLSFPCDAIPSSSSRRMKKPETNQFLAIYKILFDFFFLPYTKTEFIFIRCVGSLHGGTG